MAYFFSLITGLKQSIRMASKPFLRSRKQALSTNIYIDINTVLSVVLLIDSMISRE